MLDTHRVNEDIIRLIEFTCSLSVIWVLVTLVYRKYVLEYLVRLIMHNANSCFTCRECTNCTHSFPKLGWFLTYCCGWTKVSANWSQNSLILATVIFWRVTLSVSNLNHCFFPSNSHVVSAVLSSQVGSHQTPTTDTLELNPISLTFNFKSVCLH